MYYIVHKYASIVGNPPPVDCYEDVNTLVRRRSRELRRGLRPRIHTSDWVIGNKAHSLEIS